MTRFTTAAEGLEREVSGQVRITCPADVAEVVIVPLLPRLLVRHPSLSVDLEPGETTLDLTRSRPTWRSGPCDRLEATWW